MTAKRSVAVTISGQRYTLKSDADEAYVQSLAGLVDEKMREVQRSGRGQGQAQFASPQAVAVLAALQLADDLARERARRSELRERLRARSRAIRALLDRELKSATRREVEA